MTPNGKLDRVYLRSSAIFRCLVRYNACENWALSKLQTVMNEKDARALLSIWKNSYVYRNRFHPWKIGNLF